MNRRKFISVLGGMAAATQVHKAYSATKDHVVIIGAGIMGASVGYHMAKRGARVTILEKERPGAGATQNSFAWLNAGTKRPHPYYEINLLGMAGWHRLALEIGSELPIQLGGTVQWITESGLKKSGAQGEEQSLGYSVGPASSVAKFKEAISEQESLGYSVRLVESEELLKLLPGINPGPVSCASFADQEGTVDPLGATQVLLRKAQALGAVIEYPCEVTGFNISSGRVRSVQTTDKKIEADHFVLAAGNGIPQIAGSVGLAVPLVDSPGVLAHTEPLPRLLHRVAIAEGATLKQNPDGRVVTGSDFGGTPGVGATREEGEKLMAAATRYLPALKDAKLAFVTLGHRVLPKDGISIIGSSQTHNNVYVIATHSGMTLSPLFGELAAVEVLDGVRVDLLKAFRPERFS